MAQYCERLTAQEGDGAATISGSTNASVEQHFFAVQRESDGGYLHSRHRLVQEEQFAVARRRCDQKPREEKSAPYRDPWPIALLATKDTFMDESNLGLTDQSGDALRSQRDGEHEFPKEYLSPDDIFKQKIQRIKDRNEVRFVRDITPLIVLYGANKLECLIESTNEGWNNSIPLLRTCPQPDYSVGFRREAFTGDQLWIHPWLQCNMLSAGLSR
ncbi:hypothetical protein FQN50_004274 [Emmonsiellopsis sp. PD_5]|nr:hypothetical protein FQN50_004274 [Emmonsiellopsis sp. PD_5]